jgi:AcrR family transcriptional regulator
VLKNNNKIHYGEVLRDVADKSELTITQVAKKAGFNRTTFYNHILNPDLPYHILERYGRVLKFDFTTKIPEMQKFKNFEDPAVLYQTPDTIEEVLLQRDIWRDRYYELLEKYNKVIEEALANKK